MSKKIRQYQQRCFREYLDLVGIETPYTFPEGNPIRPLPPLQTATGGLMVIGAYPSARFERRRNTQNRYRIIPVGNNLHPFAKEEYFDGLDVRVLESGDRIREYIFDPLDINPNDCWITDLVKVFLYKKDHQDSVGDIFLDFEVPVLRNRLISLGKKSLPFISDEIELCKPRLILTLGHEVAKVVSGTSVTTDDLLTTEIRYPDNLEKQPTFYLPHPDACRRNEKWRKVLESQLQAIKSFLALRCFVWVNLINC